MKPTVTTHKTAKNRISGYSADFGPITGPFEATPREAITACEAETMDALARLDSGVRIYSWNGHTYIVGPTVNAWGYWIDTNSVATYGRGFSCTMNGTRDDCEYAALSHLASSVWSHDVDDLDFLSMLPDPRMRADLLSQFTWYREMKRLTDKGYDDHTARAVLSGHRSESDIESAIAFFDKVQA